MAKEKFDRSKPHVNIGTIGHIDHGKTTLTAAITKVLSKHNPRVQFRSFDSIDNAPEEKARGITIAMCARGVRDGEAALCARGLSGPRRLHQEHDHGRGADGRGDSGGGGAGRADAADAASTCCWRGRWGCPAIVVALNKVDMMDDPELLELVELELRELLKQLRVSGRRGADCAGERAEGAGIGDPERRSKRIEELMEAVDNYIPTAAAGCGQAVPDAD